LVCKFFFAISALRVAPEGVDATSLQVIAGRQRIGTGLEARKANGLATRWHRWGMFAVPRVAPDGAEGVNDMAAEGVLEADDDCAKVHANKRLVERLVWVFRAQESRRDTTLVGCQVLKLGE
jgi:hypothetical protein